jgi:DnaJ family protein A protein 5
MRCHYEVLEIERHAEVGEIRKAFHKAALKYHPDKHQNNHISPEEATLKFQEIQNAYEVLSDPHEKKWYDEHREQILRGENNNNDEEDQEELNLWKYFSPSIYTGFQDDEKGFYHVYQTLFEKVSFFVSIY